MSPKDATTFRIDVDVLEAMRDVRERKGIPVTTQIEMAVREWLKKEHGLTVKAPSRRSPKRRKG